MCSVTGEKINFDGEFMTNVTLNDKTMKTFVMKNATKLFGTEWMQQFNLWNIPIIFHSAKYVKVFQRIKKFKRRIFKKNPRGMFWWVMQMQENVR